MKKQYTVHRSGAHSTVTTYGDGEVVNKLTFWCDEAMYDELDVLQEKGFSLAFSEEEISFAKQNYEYMLAHQLVEKKK